MPLEFIGFAALGMLTFGVFLIWDAYSIYAAWMTCRGRKVPSGTPLVSLLVYGIVCIPSSLWSLFFLLVIYHLVCQLFVPIIIFKLFECKDK
jgi:hypothetical protein